MITVFKRLTDETLPEPVVADGLQVVVHFGARFVALLNSAKWPKLDLEVEEIDVEAKKGELLEAFYFTYGDNAKLYSQSVQDLHAFLIAPTLDQAIHAAKNSVKAIHAEMLAKLSGDYTIEDRDTWPQKQKWAQAYIDDKDEEAGEFLTEMLARPQVSAIVKAGGDPAQVAAENIAEKARINSRLVVTADRVRAEANLAFDNAKSIEDVVEVSASLTEMKDATITDFLAFAQGAEK